jgi:nondiscriminating aspartyl-tRNA synthetase
MQRTSVGQLPSHLGEKVKLVGWLQTLRDQKKMQFIILRDRSGTVQVVFEKKNNPVLGETISKLTPESAIAVTGTAMANPIVKLGGIEVQFDGLEVINLADSPLPLDPFAETLPDLDFRLDWRYLDLRRPVNQLLFRVQTTALAAMRQYWLDHEFMEMFSPKIVGSPSESGAELFTMTYFEREAYLAQSPQFYKQMAIAAGWEGVFEIGPAFRADPSFTSRHMTEFTSVDMEMAWIDSHHDVMAFEERWLQATYQAVKDKHGEEIKALFNVDLQVPTLPFPKLTMAEAYAILKAQNYALPPERKGDIDPGGERLLGKYIKDKYNHDSVFIIDWPISVRPFYHMRYADNPTLTKSFDLLGCGLEITTGAQREHRYEVLKAQAFEKGLSEGPISDYLNFFRYGCPPHGGFGFGLSRLMMIMLGISNIRETVYLFRGPNRLNP